MCGICGIYNLKNNKKIEESILDDMLHAIRHRGSDGSSKTINDHVALGFNRLGFLDLENGMQPLYNNDRSVMMICNGEIYNYQELRDTLIARGHIFTTKTDVEVIPHLYDEYGADFPKYLNGQFAIALYDRKKESLFLVRDPVGICPLYYTVFDERILFASEIKALLEYPSMPRKLNLKAVDQLLNFPGAISPATFFDGISSLPAGHMLACSANTSFQETEYWDMLFPVDVPDRGEEYYAENVRELLKNAISQRLNADVPIGFYLSGGLDSSMVACFIDRYHLNSSISFSAQIETEDLDESPYQRLLTKTLHTEHYSVKVTDESIYENLKSVIYHAESAIKESYDTAAFLLSSLVSASPAKAVLTGQGSDEFFCGYAGYMLDNFRNMKKNKMNPAELELNEHLWGDKYFRYERNHPEIRKIHRQLYSESLRGAMEDFSALKESPIDVGKVKDLSPAKRRSYIDYKLRLSDHLLIEHGDHMFFSHSVEGRHPFLDLDLLNFAATIPDVYKINGTDEKYILKCAGKGIVPDAIRKRKKFPFQAQGMSSLLKTTHIENFLDETLIKRQNVFDTEFVKKMCREYRQDGFRLMGAYEIDYLMIVMTVTLLCEEFSLSI